MITKHNPGETTGFEHSSGEILTAKQMFLKATGLSLLFALGLLLITGFIVGLALLQKMDQFLSVAGLTFGEAKTIIAEGISHSPRKTNGKTTILILGIDTVLNKQSAQPLTDTIILATLDYSTGSIKLISLPRDLWSPEYKTKINALYYYGQERYPDQPERFSTEVISTMTAVPIDYTVVFSLQSITKLVNVLGGLEVAIPTSFTDIEFPREDIDLATATSEAELYQTVQFTQGTERMTPERVTQYIRSRHSQGDTGTDTDRAARQQLILNTLVTALMKRSVLTNPEILAKLYLWYQDTMATFIPLTEAVSIGYSLIPVRNNLQLTSQPLRIYPDTPNGTITHPPVNETDNQWTYIIKNQQLFEEEIYDKLGI